MSTGFQGAAVRAIQRITYNSHVSDEQAVSAAGSEGPVNWLLRTGKITRDPGYSGCLVTTEAGYDWLEFQIGVSP